MEEYASKICWKAIYSDYNVLSHIVWRQATKHINKAKTALDTGIESIIKPTMMSKDVAWIVCIIKYSPQESIQ